MTGDGSGQHFTVLVVCIGNVCRSPAVEHLLRSALNGDGTVAVHSAGTRAQVDRPIQPPMERLLERHGHTVDGFAARAVTATMLAHADLVLAATRELRGDVADILPSVVRRLFTVREFARLASSVKGSDLEAAAGPDAHLAARLDALIPLAAARRAEVPVELDDIVDPFLQSDEVYQRSYQQAAQAVRQISMVTSPDRGHVLV
ncbi:low molecular weight phosphatase family protein [Georgenia satyanarayanai]|uniref:arsenate reductase/protein-tyrosine-phosphatase family protein n=1 Tax=Georgenia satyanarayanai TaxID=860221 RepID=UPI00203DFDDE|nr:low molecular weight phosphatase family protein [Georgenia satyanarayanai]MCM3661336.1 low molecular weight phosphatase family protein [Georgenia satyanarayanai]